MKPLASEQKKLLSWFKKNQRELPWRKKQDPYSIWVSEVMLQQTTSKAVIPYYQKFLKKFPTLSDLAKAKKKEVFAEWSGLGYYQRAENLLKASQMIKKQKRWPKCYKELLKLPGFGDYTARAVSSLAFGEAVGVLDGNVIRFLSRFYALKIEHWKSKERARLQALCDKWVQGQTPSQINQALMEIGSLICVSPKPLCLLCPLTAHCKAYKKSLQEELPLKKEKKHTEFWLYEAERIKRGNKWAFVKNKKMPFLKGRLLFPGRSKKITHKAKHYDLKHSIMNYQIFIIIKTTDRQDQSRLKWHSASEIKKVNPSSLITKIINFQDNRPLKAYK